EAMPEDPLAAVEDDGARLLTAATAACAGDAGLRRTAWPRSAASTGRSSTTAGAGGARPGLLGVGAAVGERTAVLLLNLLNLLAVLLAVAGVGFLLFRMLREPIRYYWAKTALAMPRTSS